MSTTEHTINDVIAKLLSRTKHAWNGEYGDIDIVSSEQSGMLLNSAKRPDIIIVERVFMEIAEILDLNVKELIISKIESKKYNGS